MLQTTTEGKNTSSRGAVIVSTVVTTVALRKSANWAVWMVNFYLLPTLRIVVEGEGRTTEGDDDDEGPEVELQTNLREDYAKFYKQGEGPYYGLLLVRWKPTSAFTFKTLSKQA